MTQFIRWPTAVFIGLSFVTCAAGHAAVGVEPSLDALANRLESLRVLRRSEMSSAARTFLADLDESTVLRVVTWLDSAPPDPAVQALLEMTIERWAELDGRAAYAHARAQTSAQRPSLEAAALFGWAVTDPTTAWMTMMQLSNRGADRRYPQLELLSRIAESDLELALECFEDLVPDRTCLECSASNLAAIAYHQRRMAVVADRLARMRGSPFRHALRHGYWHVYGCFDSARALQLLEDAARTPDYVHARNSLCAGWARSDFELCLDYIVSHVESEQRADLLTAAIQNWALGAVAEDVAAVVKRLPAPIDERALLGTATVLAAINPRVTMEWIESQPESALRIESFDRSMQIWARTDGEAAGAYIRTREDVSIRGVLLWTYLLASAQNHSLQRADLELLDDRFTADWSAQLLERIAVRLVDPATRGPGASEREFFAGFVRGHAQLSEPQKARILQPLK